MNDVLKQLIDPMGDIIGLYRFSSDIEDEIIRTAYINYLKSEKVRFEDFEDFWNNQNEDVKVERFYIEEVNIYEFK